MHLNLHDLTGQKFGRLTVLERFSNKKHHTRWLCICECGNTCTPTAQDLKRGGAKSCGCLRREMHTKHGQCNHRLYKIWNAMRQRCNNPHNDGYKDYGGRGILICSEWDDFNIFLRDMESTWKEGLELDRLDNNGPYIKWNCAWKTSREQKQNTRLVEEAIEKRLQEVLENLKYNLPKYSEGELIELMTKRKVF